ncbi:MAG: DUF3105 domain-containing protein [Propionicimonas sp.]
MLREATRSGELRKRRRRLALWMGVGVVVIALAITVGVLATRPQAKLAEVASAVTYPNLARGHVSGPVAYAQTPPVGGDHALAWQNCGVYLEPVPNENAVHSLEHGAIWVTYRPDLPADQVKLLQAAVKGQPYGLLSPFPDLPAPVAASVWGVQLKVQSASDPELATFLAKYADASQAPEPRGECTGGVGTPQR